MMEAVFTDKNILLQSDSGWARWLSLAEAETLAASLAAAIVQAKEAK